MDGLRPSMPDSAPEEYKELAKICCDADPGKRPDVQTLKKHIDNIYKKVNDNEFNSNNLEFFEEWRAIYHNNVRPLSRLEKESKYSSKVLSTGNLSKPRNSYDLESAAGMKTTTGCYM